MKHNLHKKTNLDEENLLEATQSIGECKLALKNARGMLSAVHKDKSEFLSIAAHQLRTPLTSIRWAHQMLLDGELGVLTKQQEHLLLQSQQSIVKMVTLMTGLINSDKLEFGKITYELQPTELLPILSETIKELVFFAEKKETEVTLSADEKIPKIIADKEHLKEAFLNIVDNAIKYTPAQGSVDISVESNESSVVVIIKDTGIGIPQENADSLFDKFYRADNVKESVISGTGLGLYISRKIINAHKGELSIESSEGNGTTVRVEFSNLA